MKRDRLWEVLRKTGVSSKFIKTLQAIYDNVRSRVRSGPDLSGAFECPIGLRQGCRLSPIIFSLLINEVADTIYREGGPGYQFRPGTIDIRILMFADDITLIALTPRDLQILINILDRVASDLGLSVNLGKSKVIVFRKGGFLAARECWFLGQKCLETVNSYKYLGLTLTTKLSMKTALSEFVGRAKRKIIDIHKLIHSIGYMSPQIYFKLIDSIVTPLALYSAEVWGLRETPEIESINTFACKRMLGVTKRTPNCLVYGELGRYPITITAKLRAVKYWLKITEMDEERIPKLAYYRELMEENKKHNWARGVKQLLEENGFGFVWESQGVLYLSLIHI